MRRFALLVGAAAVLAATAPLAVATTASAAPLAPAVVCGKHYVDIDFSNHDAYWGNCGTTNTNVTYYRHNILRDSPPVTVCAPAGQDIYLGRAVGNPGGGIVTDYYVTNVSGTC